jgi:hypothetical protein
MCLADTGKHGCNVNKSQNEGLMGGIMALTGHQLIHVNLHCLPFRLGHTKQHFVSFTQPKTHNESRVYLYYTYNYCCRKQDHVAHYMRHIENECFPVLGS